MAKTDQGNRKKKQIIPNKDKIIPKKYQDKTEMVPK